MFDLFSLSILVLIVTIVAFIVRAVRVTNASIARAGQDAPLSRPDVARRVAGQMRARDVRCTRCGQPTFAMLGTGNRYKCENEMCSLEFDGPGHFPADMHSE
jgi:hypothetical protein